MHSQIILVCSTVESREAAQTGLPFLRFGLGLSENGTLLRTVAQNHASNDILCLSDFGVTSPISQEVIRQLLEEARSHGGILTDIERENAHIDSFLHFMDQTCSEYAFPLFVPYKYRSHAPNSWLIVPGAASGGSLQDELKHGMELQKGRLAVSFQFIRRKFHLPTSDPHGEEITAEELLSAQQRTGAHVFFSRELCLNYFTYMEGDVGVFVLFDTPETLQMRLDLIRRIGVPYILMEWKDCESLFNRS